MTFRNLISFALILFTICIGTLLAEVPNCINYQGYLTNPAGEPVANGIYELDFCIYASEAGTDLLWTSGVIEIQVLEGMFSFELGSNIPFPDNMFTGDTIRYLGISVGSDPELIPRTRLMSASYAHHASVSDALTLPANIEGADNINPTLSVQNTGSGVAIYGESGGGFAGYFEGNTQITGNLNVDGNITGNGLGDITGVNAGSGLEGGGTSGTVLLSVAKEGITSSHLQNNTITNSDISETANIYRDKISGTAAILNGSNEFTGMNSFSDDIKIINNGISLFRDIYSRWHIGDYTTTGLQFKQVYDDNNIYQSRIVMELGNDGTVGIGNIADDQKLTIDWNVNSASTRKGEKISIVNSGSGNICGLLIYAEHSTPGMGNNCTALSVDAVSDATYRYGIYTTGEAQNQDITTGSSYGIVGRAYDGQTAYGVYGLSTSAVNNWSGYFNGNCRVTGTFDNSKSTIRIDHPLDPENKTLEHATVNSPDMLNIYSGNITSDDNGIAIVDLPDYFEALNDDFRYQLTIIGSFAQAIIKEKISNNQFIIATSEPNIEVSWMVTGVRKDAFANANPVKVEQEKSSEECGYYINPEAFGLDETRSTDYATNPAFRRSIDERSER